MYVSLTVTLAVGSAELNHFDSFPVEVFWLAKPALEVVLVVSSVSRSDRHDVSIHDLSLGPPQLSQFEE